MRVTEESVFASNITKMFCGGLRFPLFSHHQHPAAVAVDLSTTAAAWIAPRRCVKLPYYVFSRTSIVPAAYLALTINQVRDFIRPFAELRDISPACNMHCLKLLYPKTFPDANFPK